VDAQELLMEGGAVVLLASTLVLVRLRLLSIRYGLGWLAVSVAGLGAGPVLMTLGKQAEKLGFTPTGFSAGVFIVFLGLLCLQLSISLSGLHSAVQNLSEHAALVEERLRRLEASRAEESDVEPDHARVVVRS
jgi:Na+/melibiose symporter-like transporter